MKLSDAIDEGSLLSPQAFDSKTPDSTCALQAACEALGLNIRNWTRLSHIYPWLLNKSVRCPECNWEHMPQTIIFHLNDNHRWPRPSIAAWVRTIEPVEAVIEMKKEEMVARWTKTCPFCSTENFLDKLESQEFECECGAFYKIAVVENWVEPPVKEEKK